MQGRGRGKVQAKVQDKWQNKEQRRGYDRVVKGIMSIIGILGASSTAKVIS